VEGGRKRKSRCLQRCYKGSSELKHGKKRERRGCGERRNKGGDPFIDLPGTLDRKKSNRDGEKKKQGQRDRDRPKAQNALAISSLKPGSNQDGESGANFLRVALQKGREEGV